MKKYLDIDLVNTYKGETKFFKIYNTETGDLLGEIKWNSGWRQYCFYPDYTTYWSRGCIKEVYDFIDKLMEERTTQNTRRSS